MPVVSQLVNIAASQIGIKEVPSGSNKVKYWDYYRDHSGLNLNGSPWCAAFVTWCMSEIGAWAFYQDEARFRYCPSTVNWAKSSGQWVDRSQGAQPGDIVLFGNKGTACHIGIVEKVLGPTQIQTIEGNTSVTSNDNGGSVMRRIRDYGSVGSSWYVMGFVRTPWDTWIKDSKGWYLKRANGTKPTSKWVKLDNWYWFDADGYAVSSCWKKLNNKWYWFNSDCRMAVDWKKIKSKWYYLNKIADPEWPEGAARTGWVKLNGLWYYLEPSKTDKNWPECSARTGWITYKGKKCYLRKLSDGGVECSMVTGKFTIDGKEYTFDKDGYLVV